MILKYALSPDEYLEAQRAYRMRLARGRVFFRNLYGLACLAAVVATYARLSGHRWWGIALYLAAVLLVVERRFLWRWRAARSYRDGSEVREPVELSIEENSLHRISPSGTTEIRWANIHACHETKNLFLLQLSPAELLIIPRRALSPGDLFRLKEFLEKELIVKSTHENQDALLLKFVVSWGLGAIVLMTLFSGYFYNFLNQPSRYPRGTGPTAKATPPVKPSPASVTELRGRGSVYLVPIGEVKSVAIPPLLEEFRRRYNLKVGLLPAISLPGWAENSIRKQYAAEDLVEAMKLDYPQLAADPGAALIGLTDSDMYVSGIPWKSTVSFRDEDHSSVLSTAHLLLDEDDKPVIPQVVQARIRKLLTRDVGILHYRLQLSRDYNSVLYEYLEDTEDVDDAGEDYLEIDAQMRADLHVQGGDPCFILRHYTLPERAHPVLGTVAGCSGYYKDPNLETVQIDLRYGLLLDQRTDFLIEDRIPLELTRVLRTQDSQSRAFGIGGNHNLNIFLVGDKWPFTWIDLVLDHGGRSHFKRANWGFGYWDARYANRDAPGTKFNNSTIEWAWPGWKLHMPGGTVYRFPDSGNVTRPEQGALAAIEGQNGDRLSLSRNAAGDLLQARSPGGNELVFDYDSNNRIIGVRDKGGDRFDYSYDSSGHLVKVTDADHRVTEYGYDQAGRMNRLTQDGVRVVTLEYDDRGLVKSETLADGRRYLFHYARARKGEVLSVDITDSAGPTRRVRMSSMDYTLDYLAKNER